VAPRGRNRVPAAAEAREPLAPGALASLLPSRRPRGRGASTNPTNRIAAPASTAPASTAPASTAPA
jgi:hypothetical protein